MKIFSEKSKSNGGLMDIIRCDEQNYLVWKWHPEGSTLGESTRENAIRWGSSLRVKEGSVAVFVYSANKETVQDYIVGPADVIINSKNLPVISSLIGIAYDGKSPFQAEIYFINLANTIQLKFAVPYFDVFDSELPEFSVPIAVRGSFDFNISDYKDFIKKHRLDNFSLSDLQMQVRDAVSENIKTIVANAPDTYGIPVVHIERKVSSIKADVIELLTKKLYDDYGIILKDINFEAIDIDKDSDGYKELKSVTKDLTSATLKSRNKAKNVAERREIKGTQTIDMLEKAAQKLVNTKETQFVRHKQAQAEYANVIEDQRAGKLGAIGGKFMRDLGNLVHSKEKKTHRTSSPQIPVISTYNVAVDGKPTGPYTIDELQVMVKSSKLTKNSLVWKSGMQEWEKAGEIEELHFLFDEIPPIPDMQ